MWAAAAQADFEWREWDGEAVVYVHATGDTHALSAEASTVLIAMMERPGETWPTRTWMALVMPGAAGADDLAEEEVLEFEHLLAGLRQVGVVCHAVP